MRILEKKGRFTFLNIIKNHIQNNIKEYMIVSILFLIGIVLGVIFINNMEEIQITQVSEYINNFIHSLKTDYTINQNGLLKTSIINDIILIILIWIIGSTVVGIPIVYAIIIFKGFSLGYTISSSIVTLGLGKGILFNLTALFFQNIIYIPCILALAVSGIRLYKSIMKDRRKENIKIEICRHTVFSLFIGLIIIASSFIEVYVSSNLLSYIVNYI